jgi:hypothetical protein
MVSELDLREELEGVLSRALRSLADLASAQRPQAEVGSWQARANAALQRVERAIELVRSEEDEPAAKPRFGRPVDWILMALDKAGKALPPDELIDRVLEYGFADGEGSEEYRRGRVTRSIAMYETGVAGKRKQVLRQVGGMIGRGEWPDERFK